MFGMIHPAYVIACDKELGIEKAKVFLKDTYNLVEKANPDLSVRRHGLFSVEDARALVSAASLTPVSGETKAFVLAVDRIYREAQNALLKILEEPPAGTVFVLVVPQTAMLLPTVLSRVLPLPGFGLQSKEVSQEAHEFLGATKEKRTAIIKKLTVGKDEDAKRALRDVAIKIIDGVELVAYEAYRVGENQEKREEIRKLLSDIETLRGYLYDRAVSLRMILEHVSLVLPKL